MIRQLAALPLLWGSVLAETVNKSTPISLSLFLGGIGGTAALVWWAARERHRGLMQITELKNQLQGLNSRIVELEANKEEVHK